MAKRSSTALEFGPPADEVASFVKTEAAEAKDALEFVRRIEVKTPADLAFVDNALQEIVGRFEVVETKRKAWVGGLKKIAADIDKTLRAVTGPLKEAEELLREKLAEGFVAMAASRAYLLKESIGKTPAEAERLIALAAAAEPPELKAASVKIEWTGEVTNAALIPPEWTKPDVERLLLATAAAGGDPGIAGWRAYQTGAVRMKSRSGE